MDCIPILLLLNFLKNTLRNQQNEGGNDLVFRNLQAARIGMLDLGKFKRQINYCLLPNGTASDRAMQVHGRYDDQGDYGFMDKMGVWFENFALPVVINECLMQSHTTEQSGFSQTGPRERCRIS